MERELWQPAWVRAEYSQLSCAQLFCVPTVLCTYLHLALPLKATTDLQVYFS